MNKKAPTILSCPLCGKKATSGHPMGRHLRDKHQMTGKEAHLISNPADTQAVKWHARKQSIAPMIREMDDDFEVIE